MAFTHPEGPGTLGCCRLAARSPPHRAPCMLPDKLLSLPLPCQGFLGHVGELRHQPRTALTRDSLHPRQGLETHPILIQTAPNHRGEEKKVRHSWRPPAGRGSCRRCRAGVGGGLGRGSGLWRPRTGTPLRPAGISQRRRRWGTPPPPNTSAIRLHPPPGPHPGVVGFSWRARGVDAGARRHPRPRLLPSVSTL